MAAEAKERRGFAVSFSAFPTPSRTSVVDFGPCEAASSLLASSEASRWGIISVAMRERKLMLSKSNNEVAGGAQLVLWGYSGCNEMNLEDNKSVTSDISTTTLFPQLAAEKM